MNPQHTHFESLVCRSEPRLYLLCNVISLQGPNTNLGNLFKNCPDSGLASFGGFTLQNTHILAHMHATAQFIHAAVPHGLLWQLSYLFAHLATPGSTATAEKLGYTCIGAQKPSVSLKLLGLLRSVPCARRSCLQDPRKRQFTTIIITIITITCPKPLKTNTV